MYNEIPVYSIFRTVGLQHKKSLPSCPSSAGKSCDFEEDQCGWYEGAGSSVHWSLTAFPPDDPGPPADRNHVLSSSKTEVSGICQ